MYNTPLNRIVIPLCLLVAQNIAAEEVSGWLEKVQVHNNDRTLVMRAKIDSGAENSSINAADYKIFERGGEKWIRFRVRNYKNDKLLIEKPIVRISRIKRHFGEYQERPVIELGFCLGKTYKDAEVNLVDRTGLDYQLLIGRNFLAGNFLIDSGATYKLGIECNKE